MEQTLCLHKAGQYIRMLAVHGLLTEEEMHAALDILARRAYAAAA